MNSAFSSIFLVGPMGAGKTAIGKRLAEALRLRFIDADRELEERTGASVNLIFELEGEPGFRQRETALLSEVTQCPGIVLATGGGAILSEANRELLRRRGFVIYLQTSVEIQLHRLAKDRQRPLLRHPDREQRLRAMARQRNSLYESVADITVRSADINVVAMTQRVMGALNDYQQNGCTKKNDETCSGGVG